MYIAKIGKLIFHSIPHIAHLSKNLTISEGDMRGATYPYLGQGENYNSENLFFIRFTTLRIFHGNMNISEGGGGGGEIALHVGI